MNEQQDSVYRFGDFALDVGKRLLTRGAGEVVPLTPKAFEILVLLVQNSGRVVDKVAALPWRPYYAPRAPARYILETHPDFLEKIAIGDEVVFEEPSGPAGARRHPGGAA